MAPSQQTCLEACIHLQSMRGRDPTGSLPDEVLQHVLSFLPSRQAVQTSVLSRRWRHLWESTPAVRVSGRGDGFRLFVNSLLRHRNDASPLRTFEIDDLVKAPQPSTNFSFFDDDDDDEEDLPETDPHPDVDLWIRHALSTCRATSLTARFDEEGLLPWRPRPPFSFTSGQLTTMHLEFVEIADGLLDFSPCSALRRLSLSGCRLNGDAIVSPSLERLSIVRCDIPIGRNTAGRTATMRISTPNLRHLQISDSCDGEQTPPSLDSMPLLTTASIRFTGSTRVYPTNGDASLLLHGLSEATSLELTASSPDGKAILQGDLRWCPTFTELKTLIRNEWCLYDDVTALACLLRHTPALEMLQLDFKSSDILQKKTKGSCIILKELFPTLENLKIVTIGGHCSYSDTKNHEILKLFSDWGIPRCKVKYALNFEAVDAAMEGENARGGQEDGRMHPGSDCKTEAGIDASRGSKRRRIERSLL